MDFWPNFDNSEYYRSWFMVHFFFISHYLWPISRQILQAMDFGLISIIVPGKTRATNPVQCGELNSAYKHDPKCRV